MLSTHLLRKWLLSCGEMPDAFNVALNTMPDLESYLLNMDDDQIDNPDDPEVKRLQMLINKTILGAKLWKDPENSTRTVYFKFHNSRNPKVYPRIMKPPN